jgi:DHA1 family bicyclomycin/chloramphenicol resistance-like MFS transporter
LTSPSRSGETLTYITLVSLVAYAAIATDLYLPAIPYMIVDLGGTTSDGQLTLSVFMVGLALGQLVFGPLSDHFGRIPVVRAGTLLFLVTSVLCALAADFGVMWATRGLQGMAAASGPVIARAMVRDRYEGNRAAQVMSTLSAAMAIIPMIAPSIGALILQFAAWPAVFVALAVFAALVLAALTRLPETTSNTSNERLTLRMVLSSFSEMLRRPSFLGYQMAGSFSFAALFVYLSTVAFFLPDVFNIPTSLFGYAFALTVFGFMTGSLINARLVMRFGMDQTLKAGLTISLLAALLIVLLSANASAHLYAMAALSSIFFLGVGLTASNASMGAISQFANKAGSASAVYGFTHALLASAIGAMAGLLYQGRLLEPALIMLGCAMLAFSGLWLVHWRSRDQQAAT